MARARAKSVTKAVRAKAPKHKIRARVRGATLELLEPMPIVLCDGDEVTVTVFEIKHKPDLGALRRAAGSWKGHVDAEALLRDIYTSRRMKSRRPVPRL
jgi:hypothetical protein